MYEILKGLLFVAAMWLGITQVLFPLFTRLAMSAYIDELVGNVRELVGIRRRRREVGS